MKGIMLVAIALLLTQCGPDNSKIEVIALQISKSAIPEGIAVHPNSQDIYISSIHEDKIFKSTAEGKLPEKVIDANNNGYSIGVGLDIWKNKLYALGKYNRKSYSILSVIALANKEVSTYKSAELDTTYFNDLAITAKGNAYITDTDNHNIYFFDKSKGDIRVFLQDDEIQYPNGIAISDDQTKLFIDSYSSGIRIYDLEKKRIMNKAHPWSTNRGIDGLKYHRGSLYFIVNGGQNKENHGLYKLNLVNHETDFGQVSSLLVNHEKMDIPTTISIDDNTIYVLANSQLTNLDQEENKIINKQKLNKTYVLKVPLEH